MVGGGPGTLTKNIKIPKMSKIPALPQTRSQPIVSGKVFCYEAGSRDLFELRHAHWLIISWNLKAYSLSPPGGRGRDEGGMDGRRSHPSPGVVPSQGRGDLVAAV